MLAVVAAAAVLARDSLSGGCCDGDGDYDAGEYFLLLWLLFVVAVMMLLLLTAVFCLLSLVMLVLVYLSSSLLRARCSLGPDRP